MSENIVGQVSQKSSPQKSGSSYYKNKYIPEINRFGKLTGWIGALLVFAPVLAVTFIFGVRPNKELLFIALAAQLSVNAVWWFIEPISFFPILGIPGTYIAFLSGNISNLRIPCAAAAQCAVGVEPGSEKATVVSTIGIAASVYVNVILLSIAVVIGSTVLQQMSPAVKESLNFLLPSLFGAVFAQFAIDDKKTALIAMGIAIVTLLGYNNGLFNWLPVDPFVAVIILPIFGTVLVARYLYSKGAYDQ